MTPIPTIPASAVRMLPGDGLVRVSPGPDEVADFGALLSIQVPVAEPATRPEAARMPAPAVPCPDEVGDVICADLPPTGRSLPLSLPDRSSPCGTTAMSDPASPAPHAASVRPRGPARSAGLPGSAVEKPETESPTVPEDGKEVGSWIEAADLTADQTVLIPSPQLGTVAFVASPHLQTKTEPAAGTIVFTAASPEHNRRFEPALPESALPISVLPKSVLLESVLSEPDELASLREDRPSVETGVVRTLAVPVGLHRSVSLRLQPVTPAEPVAAQDPAPSAPPDLTKAITTLTAAVPDAIAPTAVSPRKLPTGRTVGANPAVEAGLSMDRVAAGPAAALAAPVTLLSMPAGGLPASFAPALRPNDFSALIDRLIAAREAMQPQAVSLAVPHGEFGKVQLHFRHETGGLAVTLRSADPDFARTVQAAAAASPAPFSFDAAPSGNSAPGTSLQGGGRHAAGNGQTQQQRGQQWGADPYLTAIHSTADLPRSTPRKAARDGGIFA